MQSTPPPKSGVKKHWGDFENVGGLQRHDLFSPAVPPSFRPSTIQLKLPHKNFQLWLNERCYLVVEFTTIDGLVASFVVRLMQTTPDRVVNVARYDTAHGMAHLDLLDADENLVEKRWLGHMSFEDALTFAIRDFKTNHENYLHP